MKLKFGSLGGCWGERLDKIIIRDRRSLRMGNIRVLDVGGIIICVGTPVLDFVFECKIYL